MRLLRWISSIPNPMAENGAVLCTYRFVCMSVMVAMSRSLVVPGLPEELMREIAQVVLEAVFLLAALHHALFIGDVF